MTFSTQQRTHEKTEPEPGALRPSDYIEKALLDRIMAGSPGDALPSERELALALGVNRQPLREALQRLSRDGWIEIRHGKPTVIRNYREEGGLTILDTLARQELLDAGWISSLLDVRLALAPAYGQAAVRRNAAGVEAYLQRSTLLTDAADAFAIYDWQLHRLLCIESGNPVYPMLLNSFASVYRQAGELYFSLPGARESSRMFYSDLMAALPDAERAAEEVRIVMRRSIDIWLAASGGAAGSEQASAKSKKRGRR